MKIILERKLKIENIKKPKFRHSRKQRFSEIASNNHRLVENQGLKNTILLKVQNTKSVTSGTQ